PRGRGAAARRSGARGKRAAEAPPPPAPPQAQAGDHAEPEPTSLQVLQQKVEGATEAPRADLRDAGGNPKAYADSHLDQLQEDLAPLTRHLPEPVQDFLDRGGWWGVLAVLAFVALLWLRWILRKLRGAVSGPRRKKKKPGWKRVTVNLKEN